MHEVAFDETAAHRHFAAACFNRAWDYLDLPHRNDTQVEEMLHASHASYWHWLHVPERTSINLSIGPGSSRASTPSPVAPKTRCGGRTRCLELGDARAARSLLSRLRPRGDGARRSASPATPPRWRGTSPRRARCCRSIEELDDRERLAKPISTRSSAPAKVGQ